MSFSCSSFRTKSMMTEAPAGWSSRVSAACDSAGPVGSPRVFLQLFESSLAGVVGALALYGVTIFGASAGGLIFVAGVAAYTAGRQVLFPLRGIPRTTTYGPKVMMGSASFVALAATLALLLR